MSGAKKFWIKFAIVVAALYYIGAKFPPTQAQEIRIAEPRLFGIAPPRDCSRIERHSDWADCMGVGYNKGESE